MYDERTAAIYDLLYANDGRAPLRDARAEADRVLAEIRSHNPSAASLLDIACGTGRHLQFLGEEMLIHGLDLNRGFLEVARRRCPSAVFHEADMGGFELGRRFDAITCLFSSIAYASSVERLERTIAGIARHLNPGGVVLIEPWFTPDSFWDGHVSANYVDQPDVKIAWMHRQERDGRLSRLRIHYLVAMAGDVSHHSECHELGLFTSDEYRRALEGAGLHVSYDATGFGRGLYVATAPKAP